MVDLKTFWAWLCLEQIQGVHRERVHPLPLQYILKFLTAAFAKFNAHTEILASSSYNSLNPGVDPCRGTQDSKRLKYSNRAVTYPNKTVSYPDKICSYAYAKLQVAAKFYLQYHIEIA